MSTSVLGKRRLEGFEVPPAKRVALSTNQKIAQMFKKSSETHMRLGSYQRAQELMQISEMYSNLEKDEIL